MPLFQQTAQRAADIFLKRLTPDWVPLWDFDAPPDQVRLGLRTVVGGWAGLDKFAVASRPRAGGHVQVAGGGAGAAEAPARTALLPLAPYPAQPRPAHHLHTLGVTGMTDGRTASCHTA